MLNTRSLKMTEVNKTPLDFSQYEKYGINQKYSAFVLEFENLSESQVEDLEYEYQRQGHKIFFSEVSRSNDGQLTLKIITAQMSFTF